MDPCNNHWTNTQNLWTFRRISSVNLLGRRVQGGQVINNPLLPAWLIFFIFNFIIFIMFFFLLLFFLWCSSSSWSTSPNYYWSSCYSSSGSSSFSSSSPLMIIALPIVGVHNLFFLLDKNFNVHQNRNCDMKQEDKTDKIDDWWWEPFQFCIFNFFFSWSKRNQPRNII